MAKISNLRAIRDSLGLSQKELVKRVRKKSGGRFSQQSLSKLERNPDALSKYWPYIEEVIEEAEAAAGIRYGSPGAAESNVVEEKTADYGLRFTGVPVVGNAQLGDDGYWVETGFPVGHGDGYIAWHTDDPDAYSLKLYGDSMKPRIKHGEFVVVEPSRQPSPGDEVLVRTKDGVSMVKELLYLREGRVYLMSVNQADGYAPISVELSDIEKMHYVAGIAKAHMHKET